MRIYVFSAGRDANDSGKLNYINMVYKNICCIENAHRILLTNNVCDGITAAIVSFILCQRMFGPAVLYMRMFSCKK
jgi:hypothetical protein